MFSPLAVSVVTIAREIQVKFINVIHDRLIIKSSSRSGWLEDVTLSLSSRCAS